jgi:Ssp1 endopeptidase immunity protein Rap1a
MGTTMKTTVLGAAVVLAATFSTVASAAPDGPFYVDGNTLLRYCTAIANDEQLFCVSYIEGVGDVLTQWRDMQNLPPCLSGGVAGKQLVDIVVAYLNEHPELRHAGAPLLVMSAILSKMKCQPPSEFHNSK